MRQLVSVVLFALLATTCGRAEPPLPSLAYPVAHKGDVVDDYGGTKVADPYRWMEALDSKEVADWVAASNAVTDPYLAKLPLREHFNKRLTELWNYPRVSVPVVEGGKLFYAQQHRPADARRPIFMRAAVTAPPALVIDPNVISEDGSVSLVAVDAVAGRQAAGLRLGRRGRRLEHHPRARHGLGQGSVGRSEVDALLEHLVDEGQQGLLLLPLSGAAEEQGARGRAVGTRALLPSRRHAAVAGRARLRAKGSVRAGLSTGDVTEDGRYLLVTMFEGAGEPEPPVLRGSRPTRRRPTIGAAVKPVIEGQRRGVLRRSATRARRCTCRSDKDAPNRKVIAVDLENPAAAAWKTIVPERKEAIESVAVIGGRIVAQYLVDVQSRLRLFGLDGTPQGERRAARGGHRRRDPRPRGRAGDLVQLQLAADAVDGLRVRPGDRKRARPSKPRRRRWIPASSKRRRMFATSKDGTRVPFFLTAKKDLPLDGNNPTMLYGYGGFSVSTLPDLSPGRAGVARAGRHLGDRQHARRRRVRRGVAQGRHAREEAERLRRLHRRGRAARARRGTPRRRSSA